MVESEVDVSIGFLFHESSVQASVHEVERLPGGGCVFFGSISDLWHFRQPLSMVCTYATYDRYKCRTSSVSLKVQSNANMTAPVRSLYVRGTFCKSTRNSGVQNAI